MNSFHTIMFFLIAFACFAVIYVDDEYRPKHRWWFWLALGLVFLVLGFTSVSINAYRDRVQKYLSVGYTLLEAQCLAIGDSRSDVCVQIVQEHHNATE